MTQAIEQSVSICGYGVNPKMDKDKEKVRLGLKIKQLRKGKGLTQKELADLSGESQNNISRWENGEVEPGWISIVALAKALGIDVSEFQNSRS
jgi:transcriptional regulator with XRE-family HTH domain